MRFFLCILLLSCNMWWNHISIANAATIGNQDNKALISKITNSVGKESDEQRNRYQADRQLELGRLYSENGDYHESIECFLKADSLYMLLNDTEYHAYTLVRLYNSYHNLGKKTEYDELRKNLLSIIENDVINDPEISLIVASQIGKFYEEDGNYDKAIVAYTNSFESYKDFYGATSNRTFPICYQLSSLYLRVGNIKETSTYLDYLKLICDSNPENKEEYLSYIFLRIEYLTQIGKLGEAFALIETPDIDVERIDNSELKSLYYTSLSGLYAAIGDFEQALEYEIQALPLCKESNGEESVQYAHALLNVGEYFALNDNYLEAARSVQQAIEITRKMYGIEHQEYYKCLCKLASIYIYLDKERSNELRNECLILGKNLFSENSFEHADDLMFSVELSLSPSDEDLDILKKALGIRKTIGRDFDSFYLSNLHLYSTLLFIRQEWDLLLKVSQDILSCTKDFIRLNFQSLSSYQRESLWNTVKTSLGCLESFAANYSNYAIENNDYSLLADFGKVAYNSRLVKKGLLLNSNRILEDLIASSNDPSVLEMIKCLNNYKQQLEHKDITNLDIQSLKTQIYSLERNLIQKVAPNGEFIDFLSIDYEDIQSVLNVNEVAIEFFSYNAQNHVQYGAVILSHDSNPLTVALFCEDELLNYAKSDETGYDYDNPGLYRTIWAALETFSEVRDAETIYFSADNILNTIAIESLIDEDGIRANDKRNLFRLSSTREIVLQHESNTDKSSAILYGGLNYDATLESVEENSMGVPVLPYSKFKRQSHTRSSRGTYEFLPGTLVEVNNISSILQEINSETLTGERGHEGSFISLNGISPTLIHLATHGFFYEPEEIEDKLLGDPVKYAFLNLSNLDKVSIETQAMRGSGILFSGANHTLKGLAIPKNTPDGILTAEELSNFIAVR